MQLEMKEDPSTIEAKNQFLTFLLDKEEYGVEILNVQEIKSWGPYTPLPKSPDHVLGVINLRGAIVPIIDLRSRFKLPASKPTDTTAIIIVRSEHEDQIRIIGLVVDSVSEVYQLREENVQDAAEMHNSGDCPASSVPTNFVRAFGKIDDNLLILINLEPIVSSSVESIPAEIEL